MKITEITDRSILVVAHPDDEVLWFSSILKKVDEIIVCFLEVASQPDCTEGRRKSLASHPAGSITCLGLTESEGLNGANWRQPVLTKYGLEVRKSHDSLAGFSERMYTDNFVTLVDRLRPMTKMYKNVFTHNPWGEYGHEEHVQVYRVLKELQRESPFHLWVSNYCSNKSYDFMIRYLNGFDSEYVTLSTDKQLAQAAMDIYRQNKCWTWYDDFVWFNEECFMRDKEPVISEDVIGHSFPINLLRLPLPEAYRQRSLHQGWKSFLPGARR